MRILLVADVPKWAFDINMDAIIKCLPQYKIDKAYSSQFNSDFISRYDHVHFMNWLEAKQYAPMVSGGVASHNFELLHKRDSDIAFPKFKALLVTSQILYDKVKGHNPKVYYAPSGVREDLFVPVKKTDDRKFVVGWVGQKTFGGLNLQEADRIDIKGYNLILKPLIERLKKYPDIEVKVLDRWYTNAIPYELMPRFYDDVDCQICTSLAEGTPNPMFEAASCGKALISTRIGAVSEFIQHDVNGFMVDSYDKREDLENRIGQFETYILMLRNDRKLCREMGTKSRELIEGAWTWRDAVKRWIPFFEDM